MTAGQQGVVERPQLVILRLWIDLLLLEEEGRCWLNFDWAGGRKHGRHVEGLGRDLNATFEGLKCHIWMGLLRTASEKELSLIAWDS